MRVQPKTDATVPASALYLNERFMGQSWHPDIFLSIFLFSVLVLLRPSMPDGDGLSWASQAIYHGFLEGMVPKHLIFPALLRTVYLFIDAIGLRKYSIEALTLVSNLATVGIFLLLTRVIFAAFIKDRLVLYACAMGVVLSFGVLSRGSAIEVYDMALLTNLVLISVCLTLDFRRPWHAVGVGLIYCVAVGIHVTNVLLGPFVAVTVIQKAGHGRARRALIWASVTFLLGLAILYVLLLIGKGSSLWPPDLIQVLPTPDAEPRMSLIARLGRAVYGLSRSFAWLVPVSELHLGFAVAYVTTMLAAVAVVLYLASHGLFRRLARYRRLILMLTLIGLPFIAIGVFYFPSDPERWLFLTPEFWLVIGLVWTGYVPPANALINKPRSKILLVSMVLVLGLYNSVYKLLPEVFENRQLSGFIELSRVTASTDLVITPAGITGPVYEFFLGRPFRFRNLTFTSLVDKYKADRNAMETDLRTEIEEELQRGHHVYVHDVFNEGHVKGGSFPWGHWTEFDYGPETFLAVLREFNPMVVIPPSKEHTGTFRLQLNIKREG